MRGVSFEGVARGPVSNIEGATLSCCNIARGPFVSPVYSAFKLLKVLRLGSQTEKFPRQSFPPPALYPASNSSLRSSYEYGANFSSAGCIVLHNCSISPQKH